MPSDHHFTGCLMMEDNNVATTAVITLTWAPPGTGNGCSLVADFATFDAGRTWRPLGTAQTIDVTQVASVGNTIYAVRTVDVNSAYQYHIWASGDQMRTWHRLDPANTADVQQMWLNPATGALLAETAAGQTPSLLYSTTDHGATWTQLTAPAFDSVRAQRVSGSGRGASAPRRMQAWAKRRCSRAAKTAARHGRASRHWRRRLPARPARGLHYLARPRQSSAIVSPSAHPASSVRSVN
jgi:hypothetical protein